MSARAWLTLNVILLAGMCIGFMLTGGWLDAFTGLACALNGFAICIQVERIRKGE